MALIVQDFQLADSMLRCSHRISRFENVDQRPAVALLPN